MVSYAAGIKRRERLGMGELVWDEVVVKCGQENTNKNRQKGGKMKTSE